MIIDKRKIITINTLLTHYNIAHINTILKAIWNEWSIGYAFGHFSIRSWCIQSRVTRLTFKACVWLIVERALILKFTCIVKTPIHFQAIVSHLLSYNSRATTSSALVYTTLCHQSIRITIENNSIRFKTSVNFLTKTGQIKLTSGRSRRTSLAWPNFLLEILKLTADRIIVLHLIAYANLIRSISASRS